MNKLPSQSVNLRPPVDARNPVRDLTNLDPKITMKKNIGIKGVRPPLARQTRSGGPNPRAQGKSMPVESLGMAIPQSTVEPTSQTAPKQAPPTYSPSRGVEGETASLVDQAMDAMQIGVIVEQHVKAAGDGIHMVMTQLGQDPTLGVPTHVTQADLLRYAQSKHYELSYKVDSLKDGEKPLIGPALIAELSETIFSSSLKGGKSWRSCVSEAVVTVTALYTSKVKSAFESLILWLKTVGFQVRYEPWMSRRIQSFMSYFLMDRYEPYMKFITAYVQACGLDNSLEGPDPVEKPPHPGWLRPEEKHFLGGSAYTWFSSRTGRHAKDRLTALSLLNSITGLKKRQPEIPTLSLHQATSKWFPSLFGPRSSDDPTLGKYEDAYKNTVKEVVDYLKRRSPTNVKVSIPFPGLKARYDSAIKLGGTMGAFRRALLSWLEGDDDEGTTLHLKLGTFVSGDEAVEIGAVLNTHVLDIMELLTQEFPVVPKALPEPFKVRMISKAESVVMWQASAIQKFTHALIQRLPELRLTKESPDHDIEDILSSVVSTSPLGSDHFNVAGDYTGATDNLKSAASNPICDAISSAFGFSPAVSTLYRKSLTGHIVYEDDVRKALKEGYTEDETVTSLGPESGTIMKDGKPVKFWRQTWGQLMGSPTSFPVLCLANYCATLAALRSAEPKESRRKVGKSGIVINGDDIAFQATKPAISSWRGFTIAIGLSPSLGKNFVSKEFIQINSKMFVLTSIPGPLRPGEPPLHRWVLLHTASLAVLAPARSVSFSEFCLSAPSWQAQFLGPTKGPERERLCQLWHEVWMPQLKALPSGLLNWYIPRELGGFGIEPSNDDWEINGIQSHAAAYHRDHVSYESYRLTKLSWDQPDATTTVHSDSTDVLRRLEKGGLLEFAFLEPREVEFTIPHLPLAQVLSGWAGDWTTSKDPDTCNLECKALFPYTPGMRVEDEPSTGVQGQSGWLITRTKAISLKDERMGWLTRSMRSQRKASKSTSREMTKLQIQLWKTRSAGYRLMPGVTFLPSFLQADLSKGQVISSAQWFPMRDPTYSFLGPGIYARREEADHHYLMNEGEEPVSFNRHRLSLLSASIA